MEKSCSETESTVFQSKKPTMRKNKKKKSSPKQQRGREGERWQRKNRVTLEGYIESSDNSSDQGSESGSSIAGRTNSLTDEDLEDLKGSLDLGFGFSYDEIPELCSTLPALELCYSMTRRFLDDQNQRSIESDCSSQDFVNSPLTAKWKISSPGDQPEEVKARLKYWAQAVACTVRLCK